MRRVISSICRAEKEPLQIIWSWSISQYICAFLIVCVSLSVCVCVSREEVLNAENSWLIYFLRHINVEL